MEDQQPLCQSHYDDFISVDDDDCEKYLFVSTLDFHQFASTELMSASKSVFCLAWTRRAPYRVAMGRKSLAPGIGPPVSTPVRVGLMAWLAHRQCVCMDE